MFGHTNIPEGELLPLLYLNPIFAFVTVNGFLGERQLDQEENPEFLERLRHAVKSLRDADTIPNAQVMQEAKQWITK